MATKEPLYKAKDHVRASIEGYWYYGFVVDSRPTDSSDIEYQVDFYSQGLGKTWLPEGRIGVIEYKRNPKKLLVLIQISDKTLLSQAGDGLYEMKDLVRKKCWPRDITFLRGNTIAEALVALERNAEHSIIVILDQASHTKATIEQLQGKGASFVIAFQGTTAKDLVICFEESVIAFCEAVNPY